MARSTKAYDYNMFVRELAGERGISEKEMRTMLKTKNAVELGFDQTIEFIFRNHDYTMRQGRPT